MGGAREGFAFELPAGGFVLFSPDPAKNGGLPELDLAMKLGALMSFAPTTQHPNDIVMNSPSGTLELRVIELLGVLIANWRFSYERDGERWIQHKYGVVLGENRTIVLSAQAPEPMWDQMDQGAFRVATSLQLLG